MSDQGEETYDDEATGEETTAGEEGEEQLEEEVHSVLWMLDYVYDNIFCDNRKVGLCDIILFSILSMITCLSL